MRKILSLILVVLLAAIFAIFVFADDVPCEHDFLAMRNLVSHYEECQKCYEIRGAGNHTFVNGKCTVCGCEETIIGEGEHEHILMKGADAYYHFEECQVCHVIFEVKDHTFKDGKCTVCGYAELVNPFNDVSENAWYYSDVIRAFADGLINGKTGTTFAPDLNITYVEAIKLAACMHQKYTDGVVTLTVGNPWYEPYVKYCIDNGIIREEHGYDLNAPATRQGYMRIFAYSLPAEALEEINYVAPNSIPDVQNDPAIYKLYRAGIVGGVDAQRNCNPDANIKRSEVAAVLTRMMYKAARIEFTLGEKPSETEPDNGGAVEIPEIEPDNSAVVETPDMYPELAVIGQPAYKQNADEGEAVSYWVIADGGKEPYKYQWYSRYRNDGVAVENGEYIKGADTDTLRFTYGTGNPYSDAQFYCEVTDALGSTVRSDYVRAPEAMFVGIPQSEMIEHEDGFILNTRVQSGSIKVGQAIIIYSEDLQINGYAYVSKIIMFNKELDEATAGDNAGLLLTDFTMLTDSFEYLENSCSEKALEKLLEQKNFIVKGKFVTETHGAKADIGDEATLLATVLGGRKPYSYKWQMYAKTFGTYADISDSNKDISGVDKEALVISQVLDNHYRIEWRCVVNDADGNIAYPDNAIKILPISGLKVSVIPQDIKADAGDTVTFTADAVLPEGSSHVKSYQWQIKTNNHKDFVNIEAVDTWASGYDTNTLKMYVENHDLRADVKVQCKITSSSGEYVVTPYASLLPKSVIINGHPENIVGKDGETVEFKVSAIGGKEPYTYQWYYTHPDFDGDYRPVSKDFEWVNGRADKDTLSITVLGDEMSSEIQFRCEVTDGTGRKVTSKSAYVIVTADAGVNLETGHAPKDSTIVLMQ